MDFEAKMSELIATAEAAIRQYLPAPTQRPEAIHEVMHYCMDAGGKRLRPVLVLAAAELARPIADPKAAAAAVEYLHTYSLIHDDLPCMDDSPLRRGRASAHVKFGETLAVLAGDAMLTLAFQTIGDAYAATPSIGLELVRLLADAGGSERLIGGQVEDTLAENNRISAEDLDYIHLNKTAALIETSLLMGLATTMHDADDARALQRVGRHLGVAFQIVDDLLDVTGDEATVGKSLGRDEENHKNTHVQIHGIEASRRRVHELTEEALVGCRMMKGDTAFLEHLIRSLEHRIR